MCGLRDPVLGPVRAGAAQDCAALRVRVSDHRRAAPQLPFQSWAGRRRWWRGGREELGLPGAGGSAQGCVDGGVMSPLTPTQTLAEELAASA